MRINECPLYQTSHSLRRDDFALYIRLDRLSPTAFTSPGSLGVLGRDIVAFGIGSGDEDGEVIALCGFLDRIFFRTVSGLNDIRPHFCHADLMMDGFIALAQN